MNEILDPIQYAIIQHQERIREQELKEKLELLDKFALAVIGPLSKQHEPALAASLAYKYARAMVNKREEYMITHKNHYRVMV